MTEYQAVSPTAPLILETRTYNISSLRIGTFWIPPAPILVLVSTVEFFILTGQKVWLIFYNSSYDSYAAMLQSVWWTLQINS